MSIEEVIFCGALMLISYVLGYHRGRMAEWWDWVLRKR